MAGIIESEDPGRPTLSVWSSTTMRAGPPPNVDVEELTDRLRLMGIDAQVIDEARRRLVADVGQGTRWLQETLRALEPPRKPPACDCGSVLVGPEWRGRATVRCDQCGSRWGIEVADETEAQWSLSGPSEEWRSAHPVEETFLYGDFQPEDVLERGLPPMPTGIEPGTWFPVATWRDDRFAAVLYVYRMEPGEFDVPGDEYEPEIEYMRWDPDDGWLTSGSGGGGWINPFSPPEDLLQKYGFFSTGTAGTIDDGVEINFIGGLCRDDIRFVEVDDAKGTNSYPIPPECRIFVVGAYGSGARVRLLNSDGSTAAGRSGELIEFELT